MPLSDDSKARDKARLWVLVIDQNAQAVRAVVEYRVGTDRSYRRLSHDDRLQRYAGEGMDPGWIHLRIRGPRKTAVEHREVELRAGDNLISVMVAPPGTPALRTPSGPFYFDIRPDVRLLHVRGERAQERAEAALRRQKLPFVSSDEILPGTPENLFIEVRVGTGRRAGPVLKRLAEHTVKRLKDQGLQAQILIPGCIDKKVAFGLSGEIIIRFQSGTTRPEIDELAREFRLEEVRHIEWMGNAYLFRHMAYPFMDPLLIVNELSENPLVDFAEINIVTQAEPFAYTPNDYLYPETPHLELIQADEAWTAIETLTSVPRGGDPDTVLGVVDPSGVDPVHPDLSGNLTDTSPKQVANFDFETMSNQTNANLPYEHGTQCASAATGQFDNLVGNCGVAPNCKLIGARLPLKFTALELADIWVWMAGFPTGSTNPAFPPQLPKGADVISNSWGLPQTFPNLNVITEALDFLTTYPRNGRGVVLVFAAGNYGFQLYDAMNPLAASPRTISVGASISVNPTNPVDSKDADPLGNNSNLPAIVDTRSYFSPYGLTMDLVSPSNTSFGLNFDPSRFADIVDPIMAAVRSGRVLTSLTVSVAAGAKTLNVGSSAAFMVGAIVLIRDPGDAGAELRMVDAVGPNSITLKLALSNAHPAGTDVRNGFGDWPSFAVSSTSLTAANNPGDTVLPVASVIGFTPGATVLVGVPGSAKAETTVVQAVGAGALTVRALSKGHSIGTAVVTGSPDFARNAFIGSGGTSHSCPTVAGAAALMLSVKPDLNWLEVRSILRKSATQIDPLQAYPSGQWIDLDGDGIPDFSQWYGYGRLNVHAAVTQAISLTLRTDAVVRDNLQDKGTVPSLGWHAESPDIWVRSANDPIPALPYLASPPHENPRYGQDNWVFLRVANLGAAAAKQIFLRALISHFPGIEFVYPDDWQPTPRFGSVPSPPLVPGTYLIGQVEVNNLSAGSDKIVKVRWPKELVPPETVNLGGSLVHWHPCLLIEAAPHDGPAVISGLAYPVKGDNNIAHRNITIDYAASKASSGLMTAVVVGTRSEKGVDALVVDRTAVPAHMSVIVRTLNIQLMRYWMEQAHTRESFLKTTPLGTMPPMVRELDLEGPTGGRRFGVTLLDRARIAVEDRDGNVLVIDASPQTQLSMLTPPVRTRTGKNEIRPDVRDGEAVLRLAHGTGPVMLPMRLSRDQREIVLVGVDPSNASTEPCGRILISQTLGDGSVSPGYQITV